MYIKFSDQEHPSRSIVINSDDIYIIKEIDMSDTEIELKNGETIHVWEDIDEVMEKIRYYERLKTRPSYQNK